MRPIVPITNPPPTPAIGVALVYLADAKLALSREIWNAFQLEDAIRSADFFISKAKATFGYNQGA